jgi:hypothetical protein
MPVSVNIPLRIRLHAGTLEGCSCAMEEALAAALSRALVKSRREVLAPRTGYAGIRMVAPEFLWRGEALEAATPARRGKIERKVREVIAQEIRRAGLLRWGRKSADAEAPLAGRVAEIFDENRGSDLFGLYSVAAYDRGGRRQSVPMKSAPAPRRQETETVNAWDPKPFNWIYKVAPSWFAGIVNDTFEHWGKPRGGAGFEGIIWKASGGGEAKLQIYLGNYQTGETRVFNLRQFIKHELRPKKGAKTAAYEFVSVEYLPAPAPGYAEWLTADDVRARIRASAKEHVHSLAKPSLFSTQEWEKQIPEVIEAEFKARTAGIGTHPELLAVHIGGAEGYYTLSLSGQFAGRAPLMPMTAAQTVVITEEGEGQAAGGGGGTAGTGAGAGAGAGEQIRTFWGGQSVHYPGISGPRGGYEPARCGDGFEGEPSLDQLPAATAEAWRRLIREIAYLLEIEPCDYAGRFCLIAASELGVRAMTVSNYSVSPGQGRMLVSPARESTEPNVIDFTPTASPAILFLRFMAGVVPRLSRLAHMVAAAYEPLLGHRLDWTWWLHFRPPFDELLVASVARHFVATTQVIFMQLLAASKDNIESRKSAENFPGWSAAFEFAVHRVLVPRQELEDLRLQLADASRDLARKLLDPGPALRANLEAFQGRQRAHGMVVTRADGSLGIRDKTGKLWRLETLDRAIALMSNVAQMIDPLINQLLADESIRLRFTSNPDNTPAELRMLLDEMTDKNAEFTQKIRDDAGFAHELATVVPPDPEKGRRAYLPGSRYSLQGIHQMAHEAVGEFFNGDRYYVLGVDAALWSLERKRYIEKIVELGTVAIAAIFCPALVTMVVATGWTIYHEAELREKKRVYGALMDPEEVLSYAQIEAELFANHIGALLNFIPVEKVFGKGLAELGASRAGKYVLKYIPLAAIKELENHLLGKFIKFVATSEGMGAMVERMIAPHIDEILRRHPIPARAEALAAEVEPA